MPYKCKHKWLHLTKFTLVCSTTNLLLLIIYDLLIVLLSNIYYVFCEREREIYIYTHIYKQTHYNDFHFHYSSQSSTSVISPLVVVNGPSIYARMHNFKIDRDIKNKAQTSEWFIPNMFVYISLKQAG